MLDLPKDAGVPPKEAVAFFRQKNLRPAFSHHEVWREEHNTAFTVAKILERDLLRDVQASLEKALQKGTTYEQWSREILPTLAKSGWSQYRTPAEVPHRLEVIFDTNLRMARAVGQWDRVQRTKRALPYLSFELGPSARHRELHVSWEGTILPVDDPWWLTHSPPLGYRCKCWLRQITRGEAQELGVDDEAPEAVMVDYRDPKTGEVRQVERGVDSSFAYPRTQAARIQALERMLQEGGDE